MNEQIKKDALVSIIMPFLNGEKFIEESINSILNQTYHHWHLMLVDDGSTDQSTQIALRYVEEYPDKIYYLEHPNRQNLGLGLSRNLGLRQSQGEYIAFLDADDIWLPEKLEKQLAIFQTYPEAGMVFGPHYRWYSWTGNPEDMKRDEIFLPLWGSDIQPDTLVEPPKFFIDYLQNKLGTPLTCGVLIRRQAIEEAGYFDAEVSFLCEDCPFFARIYLKVPVFMESNCWDRYRQHPHSTIAIAKAQGKLLNNEPQPVHLAEMTLLEKFLKKEGVTDPEIWQAMNQQLFPYRHPYLYQIQKKFYQTKNRVQQIIHRVAVMLGVSRYPTS